MYEKNYSCSKRILLASMVAASAMLTACSSGDDGVTSTLQAQIAAAGITGDPTTGRTLPAVTDPKVVLGKKLFFTKGLGGNGDAACVTCHHPTLGGGDDLSLPIGVGAAVPDHLGPGRVHTQAAVDADGGEFDGGPTVPRNAPTTFNLGMWDEALFHDGRVESLGKTAGAGGDDGAGIRTPDTGFGVADASAGATLLSAQARFPVTSPEEMRGFTFQAGNTTAQLRTALEDKLTAFGGWDAEFTAVFGDSDITYGRIAEAIGEYERSQVFVDTPWKAFVDGDVTAISESAKRGASFFFGDANCSSCHSGDFFTDEDYHVLASPQIGRGKGGNDTGATVLNDFGRFRETGDAADMYKFRTPTLLNVEVTGPWGHAGGYTTLAGMVRHMLDPEQAMANYNPGQLAAGVQADDVASNTQFALDQLVANRANNVENVHQVVEFTGANVMDLVEFLKTLTDPCVKDRECLADWIPDVNDAGPDGAQLNATDGGSLL